MSEMEGISEGLGLGLLIAGLLLGLRHGIDWDHLAAISDITATQDRPRTGVVLGTFYALGHAAVVLALGTVAILVGRSLPAAVDDLMGPVVGWTLLLLGGYVVVALIRERGEFRMRSRWMLLLGAVRSGYRKLRQLVSDRGGDGLLHFHEHTAVPGFHHAEGDPAAEIAGSRLHAPTHQHPHAHEDEVIARYGKAAALGVGMLHGVGAETPTQVVIFLAAANAGGSLAGVAVLLVFVLGLLISNSVITLATSAGFVAGSRRRVLHMSLGVVTSVVSLVVGTLLVLGYDAVLPAFFAG